MSEKKCTKDRPYDGSPGPWVHEHARQVGDQIDGWPGGDIVTYECPICAKRFDVELPQ